MVDALVLLKPANWLVAFVHGSGSSRLSPRNRRLLELGREARSLRLLAPSQLAIVADATTVEEQGALGEGSRLAGDWFGRHLARLEEQAA